MTHCCGGLWFWCLCLVGRFVFSWFALWVLCFMMHLPEVGLFDSVLQVLWLGLVACSFFDCGLGCVGVDVVCGL